MKKGKLSIIAFLCGLAIFSASTSTASSVGPGDNTQYQVGYYLTKRVGTEYWNYKVDLVYLPTDISNSRLYIKIVPFGDIEINSPLEGVSPLAVDFKSDRLEARDGKLFAVGTLQAGARAFDHEVEVRIEPRRVELPNGNYYVTVTCLMSEIDLSKFDVSWERYMRTVPTEDELVMKPVVLRGEIAVEKTAQVRTTEENRMKKIDDRGNRRATKPLTDKGEK